MRPGVGDGVGVGVGAAVAVGNGADVAGVALGTTATGPHAVASNSPMTSATGGKPLWLDVASQ